MGDASFLQASFVGGEWSPEAQGQATNPKYKTAMNVCLNGFPKPEGAWTRRPGSMFRATSRWGNPGRILPFDYTDAASYEIELTDGFARLFAGSGLVFTNDMQSVVSVSTAYPAVVTIANAPTVPWLTGDSVQFLITSAPNAAAGALVQNRQFVLKKITTTTFSLTDPVTGVGLDGSVLAWNATTTKAKLAHVLELPSPYTAGAWETVRKVQVHLAGSQNESVAILLNGKVKPQVISTPDVQTPVAPNVTPFTLMPQDFLDGPYLDPVIGSSLTQSGTSGSITLTVAQETWSDTQGYVVGSVVVYSALVYTSLIDPNLNLQPDTNPQAWQLSNEGVSVGPVGFVETDVGRMIRLFSEPQLWDSGTTYTVGQVVNFGGVYYKAFGDTATGTQPQASPASWYVTAGVTAAVWTWGRITAVNSPSEVAFTIIGVPLIYTSDYATITTWQLGVYSDTTGWPKCGTYYKGRTWFSGVDNNRADSSNANDIFNMAPTAPDGTVGDGNALSLVFDSDNTNEIFWFEPNAQGLIVGTKTGEWTIKPGPASGNITPTNVQVDRVTKVGCANILPVSAPLAIIMVSKYQRQMFELFPDVFSGRITAPEMTSFAKHLTTSLIQEIFYQSDPMPIIWGRMGNGSLIGATYTRRSSFASEDPTFVGFHRHSLGSGRSVQSISVTPSPDLTLDALSMATMDPATGVYHIEQLSPVLDVGAPQTSAWSVDDGIVPSGAAQATVNGVAGITFYGLWHLNGSTVSAFVGGLDCGDAPVTNGSMFVPFGGAFTLAYLQSIASTTAYGAMAVKLDSPAITFPAVIGFTFTSQGQILRPLAPADVGTQNGPAFAKTRRNHMFGALITAAVNGAISFGASFAPFTTLRPLQATSPSGIPVPLTQLYSGLYWNTLEDDYGFDGMLCWQVTRPVPATIAAIGGFAHGQDR